MITKTCVDEDLYKCEPLMAMVAVSFIVSLTTYLQKSLRYSDVSTDILIKVQLARLLPNVAFIRGRFVH